MSETCVEVFLDGSLLGRIYFEDSIKPTAKGAMTALRELGVKKTVMLTGDNESGAEKVSKAAGIDVALAKLLPEDKYEKIEELCREGKVLYCGDGINDSPSLARADVGIAMGALRSPAAIEAADVVLMGSDLTRIPYSVRLSKRTVRTVRANIVISLGVKIAVLALASLGLVGMWAAILADVGVCILCVTNSMRLLK